MPTRSESLKSLCTPISQFVQAWSVAIPRGGVPVRPQHKSINCEGVRIQDLLFRTWNVYGARLARDTVRPVETGPIARKIGTYLWYHRST